jgi:hypothetical protein
MSEPDLIQKQRAILRTFRQATAQRAQSEADTEARRKAERETADAALDKARQKPTAQLAQAQKAQEEAKAALAQVGLQHMLEHVRPTPPLARPGVNQTKELSRSVSVATGAAESIKAGIEALRRWRSGGRARLYRRLAVAGVFVLSIIILTVKLWDVAGGRVGRVAPGGTAVASATKQQPTGTPQALATKTQEAKLTLTPTLPYTPTPIPLTATPWRSPTILPPTTTPTYTSTIPTPEPQPVVIFEDNFDGASLNSSKWNFNVGTGDVAIGNGILTIRSSGRRYPYVYSQGNPFPSQGDFQITYRFRYSEVKDCGVGIIMTSYLVPVGLTQIEAAARQQEAEVTGVQAGVWQDRANGLRLWFRSGANRVDIPFSGPNTGWNEMTIKYFHSQYTLYFNDHPAYTSLQTPYRPRFIWIGHPADLGTGCLWDTLEVDYIKVESLP